jgi:serine O-acetyltransferase
VKLSLSQSELASMLSRMLESCVPDGRRNEVERVLPTTLERLERCFSRIALRGYRDEGGEARFDHLHGDQFAAFIYLAANTAWREFGDDALAKKLTRLNRACHALLVMYDTQLPEVFVIPHTVVTVIGKGSYGNYTVFCQNVTIANDLSTFLTVGEGVIFFPGSFAVGDGSIGDGVVVAANTTISYQEIPSHMMVRGMSPNLEVWPRKRDFLARFFTPPYPGWEQPL